MRINLSEYSILKILQHFIKSKPIKIQSVFSVCKCKIYAIRYQTGRPDPIRADRQGSDFAALVQLLSVLR